MEVTQKNFGNAKDCIALHNGIVELIISVEFGPRILFYGYKGGQNFFRVFDDHISSIDKDTWQLYGGHRLWVAPEEYPRSYYPDNEPVQHTWDTTTLTCTAPVETSTGIQKIIELQLDPNSTKVMLNHRIVNHNVWDIELSAWSLSVMNEGGCVIIPHEDYKPHPDCLTPSRPLVLWHFTSMNDPRFTWGKKYIQMRQDNTYKEKIKIGVLNTKGYEAYALHDEVFIKRHDYVKNAEYPDMGSNAEFFTMPGFLEIESLSPLTKIKPQDAIDHKETWELKKMTVGLDENMFDSIFV